MSKPRIDCLPAVLFLLLLSGCVSTQQTDALKLSPTSLSERQLQTRVYENVAEAEILSASVAILQDLGVKITEVESDLGLVTGEKMRDATEPEQVVGMIFLAMLGASTPIDKHQKIKFSLVTTPLHNQVSRVEALNDAEIFRGFFEKLDKSLFLEQQS